MGGFGGGKGSRDGTGRREVTVRYVGEPFLAAFLIAGGDSLGLLLGFGSIARPTLVLVLFLEGGVGLLLGVVIALSSSPSVSKFGETLFGTDRWSRDAEKHSKKEG